MLKQLSLFCVLPCKIAIKKSISAKFAVKDKKYVIFHKNVLKFEQKCGISILKNLKILKKFVWKFTIFMYFSNIKKVKKKSFSFL